MLNFSMLLTAVLFTHEIVGSSSSSRAETEELPRDTNPYITAVATELWNSIEQANASREQSQFIRPRPLTSQRQNSEWLTFNVERRYDELFEESRMSKTRIVDFIANLYHSKEKLFAEKNVDLFNGANQQKQKEMIQDALNSLKDAASHWKMDRNTYLLLWQYYHNFFPKKIAQTYWKLLVEMKKGRIQYIDEVDDTCILEREIEIQTRFAKLGLFIYTAQRERGGPYRKVNAMIQKGEFNKKEMGCFSECRMISYGFDFLCHYHPTVFRPTDVAGYWRGMSELTDEQFDLFQPGFEFVWPSFVSMTTDFKTALEFTKKKEEDKYPHPKSVLFRIVLGSTSAAMKLSQISQFPAESEILTWPEELFQVGGLVTDTKFPGRAVINLMYLGTSIRKMEGGLQIYYEKALAEGLFDKHKPAHQYDRTDPRLFYPKYSAKGSFERNY